MALPDPITRKEMYLNKAATGEGNVPPEPVTREEMYLAKIANGGGGASSLADLSDVEIQETSISYENLLRFNTETNKWKNVSPVTALLGSGANAGQGVTYLDDAGTFKTASAVLLNPDTAEGQALSQLIAAAIAYGKYQLDGFATSQAIMLINAADVSALCNIPCYLGLYGIGGIQWAIPLTGASIDSAAWSGNIFNNDKLFRLTVFIYSHDNAESATIMAKAEELMTYTEPT